MSKQSLRLMMLNFIEVGGDSVEYIVPQRQSDAL
jgi:hypothetical protein